MKFSSYNPVVNPNTLQNVQVRGAMAPQRFQPLMGESVQWKALGSIANMGLEIQKDVVDGKVLEANAEYNRRMSEGTSELMQRKEGAALNITEDYDDLQKKVYAEIQEKYGGYLFGDARNTFNAYTTKDDATRRAGVVKYQAGQAEAFAETQYNNQLAECRATALENGGTIANVAEGLNRMDAIVEMRYGSYGGEKVVEQKRIAAGKIVGDAVSMAIDTGDFGKAEALVNQYKDLLPTNAYIEARSKIQKQQNIRNQYFTVDAIANNFRGADGKIDLARGYAEIDRICGPNAVRRGGIGSKEDFFNAVASQESGGNYEAENGRTGAFGKYQIMPDNWPSWAEQAGLSSDAPMTPENQEIVAKYKLGDYYDKYGPEGALVAWYAGEANGARWANGEPDAIGEGGHYSWDAPQGNGDEPSVREYVQQALGHMESGDVSAFDPEKYEKLRSMLKAQYDSENALSKQAESAAYDQLLSDMKNCSTYAEAYDMAVNSGQPMDKVNRAVNVARSYFGVRPDGTPRSSSAVENGDPAVDWKALDKAKKLAKVIDVKLSAGANPTAKDWVAMKEASDLIVNSGMLTEEQVAELSDVYGGMGIVADYIDEGHSIPETYKWLLNSDTSPEIAFIAISNLNRNYWAIGKATPSDDGEEAEEGGSGGGY